MKQNDQKYISDIIRAEGFFLAFLIIVFLVKFIDVKPIGPENSEVGLATINGLFRDLIGQHDLFYKITELLGYAAIASALIFVFMGLIQLISRRSLLKVDSNIILLGGFYVLVVACYVFFEKFIVNYRPVILENELEASFPSSHTMLAICMIGALIYQISVRINIGWLKGILITLCVLVMLVIIFGRLISGVHWFTDIMGGVTLGGALTYTYVAACNKARAKQNNNR